MSKFKKLVKILNLVNLEKNNTIIDKKMKENIIEISQRFFDKLGVDYSDLSVTSEAEKIFLIKIESTDSSILIGPHGKNIDVITSILKLLIGKTIQENVVIHVEINDYMAQKEQKLFQYIASKIEYVQKSGKEITLPFFTAYERKKVHSYVSENSDVIYTKSVGEGSDRRIHLCKKDESITIDIDGNDI